MTTDSWFSNRERNEIMKRQCVGDPGKASLHSSTITSPNPRATCATPSRPPSSFPVRHSSLVNTYKQQQRINLVRKMFLDLSIASPPTDYWPQRAQTAPESYTTSTPQLYDSPASSPSAKEPRPSLHWKSATLGRHSIGHAQHSPCKEHFRFILRDTATAKPRCKTFLRRSHVSTVDINAAITEKKNNQYETNNHQTRDERHKTQCQTDHGNKALATSINHLKKDVAKNEIHKERLQYYQKTYHIVNYYLNQETRPECSISTARDGTHLLELLSSSEIISGESRQVYKKPALPHLEQRRRLPVLPHTSVPA